MKQTMKPAVKWFLLLPAIVLATALACKKEKTYCWKCHDNLGNILLDGCNKTREQVKNMSVCNGMQPAPDSCIDKNCTRQ